VAERILEHWEDSKAKFVRVMPKEYGRILREQEQIEAERMTRVPE